MDRNAYTYKTYYPNSKLIARPDYNFEYTVFTSNYKSGHTISAFPCWPLLSSYISHEHECHRENRCWRACQRTCRLCDWLRVIAVAIQHVAQQFAVASHVVLARGSVAPILRLDLAHMLRRSGRGGNRWRKKGLHVSAGSVTW